MYPAFVADFVFVFVVFFFLFFTLDSEFKNNRISCRIRLIRVEGALKRGSTVHNTVIFLAL